LLNIKICGYLNFGLKIKKNNMFNFGYVNFFFFLLLLKNLNNLNLKFILLRKKTKNINFIKSNIRYKVSKHLLQRSSNLIFLELSCLYLPNLDFFFLKNFNLLSSCVFNLKRLVFTRRIKLNSNFFKCP